MYTFNFARGLEAQEQSRRKEAQMKKLENECYSLWMDMLYRLSLASYVSWQRFELTLLHSDMLHVLLCIGVCVCVRA